MKKIISVLGAMILSLVGLFAAGGKNMNSNEDIRLQNFFNKIRSGENVTVLALGGSITTGFNSNPINTNSWAARTGAWLVDLGSQNGSKVTFMNQGVSGTDSAFAVARLEDHVISKNPDLLLLEFAMNDQWLDPKVRKRTYEAIVRSVLGKTDSAILALFVNERNSPYPSNQAEQKPICEYYNVPYVSWKDCFFAENKSASFNPFFDGEEAVHPNNAGHEKIAQFMIEKLNSVWTNLPASENIAKINRELPKVLTDCGFENATYYASDNITPLTNVDWQVGSPVHNEWQSHGKSHKGWQSKVAGAEMTFEVEGSGVGITYCESDTFRDAIAWVEYADGKTSTKIPLNCYQVYRHGYYGWAYKELVNTDEVQKFIIHVQCNKRAPKEREGKNCNITGILVTGKK